MTERVEDFYTSNTLATGMERGVTIFAALHLGIEQPEDRCVSLAVGQSAVTFGAEVARGLATMLLSASDVLEQRTAP